MTKTWMIAAAAVLVGIADRSGAQQPSTRPGDTLIVVTVPLKHISSKQAVDLLSPYAVPSRGGGVFAVPNVRAVTIRETPTTFSRMQKVLAEYDRSPRTVSLSFQLVAASNSPASSSTRDPAVASLDSLLRDVLKFTSYRLLGTAVVSASEDERVVQTIAGDGEKMTLHVWVTDAPPDGGEGSVHVSVTLFKQTIASANMSQKAVSYGTEEVLATAVNVPLGQTVVLGTAAGSGSGKALILTVKPQISAVRVR